MYDDCELKLCSLAAGNPDLTLCQVRMLLEEQNVEGEPKPFQMARNVYKSCMDKERIEQLGSQPLKNTILVRAGGGR